MPHVRLPIDLRSVAAARALLCEAVHRHDTQTRRVATADTVRSAGNKTVWFEIALR